MKDKHHCYGNNIIYNRVTCFHDRCYFLYPCGIKCGNKIEMFEYNLVALLINIVPKKELLELLQINYDISYNAAKQAVKRWKKKQN